MFWRALKDLGVWKSELYLTRKERRARRIDKREIIPECIRKVCPFVHAQELKLIHKFLYYRKLDEDIQALMGITQTINLHLMHVN